MENYKFRKKITSQIVKPKFTLAQDSPLIKKKKCASMETCANSKPGRVGIKHEIAKPNFSLFWVPGPAGIGGVLRNHQGVVLANFPINEGCIKSNEAEAFAIIQAIWIISSAHPQFYVVVEKNSPCHSVGLRSS